MLLVLWYVQPYALAGHGPYSCSPISRHVKKYQGISRLMKHDEVDRVKKLVWAGGAWTVQQTEAGRHRTAGQLHQGSLAIRSSVGTAEWAIRCGCRWRRAVAQEQWSLVVRVLRRYVFLLNYDELWAFGAYAAYAELAVSPCRFVVLEPWVGLVYVSDSLNHRLLMMCFSSSWDWGPVGSCGAQ